MQHFKTVLTKNLSEKKLHIERRFAAPVDKVWQAWTDSSILDQWWAPKPWKAETKSMDFRPGGTWLYNMIGPDGTTSFCRADFQSIEPLQSYTGLDAFCDENGKINNEFPVMQWMVRFHKDGDNTLVTIDIRFDKEEDLKTIVEMGFEEGFTAAHGNLDEILAVTV